MTQASPSRWIDWLCQAPLLEPAQRAALSRALPHQGGDPRHIFEDLRQRGWLTTFQVRQLLRGRGRELLMGPYILLDQLGEGGNGQVFMARHQSMRRVVALKVVYPELLRDPEAIQRFAREIEVLSRLSHPNIIHAYDAGIMGQALVLAMEFVDGVDLHRLVQQSGPPAVARACDYIRQAAEGLQHAYERGLVHRDIKPANLLLARSHDKRSVGVVKILDLGLARLLHPAGSSTGNLTVIAGPTTAQGTTDYQAPEQALDFHAADIRADLYSLGCTFYYLLTGRPPFVGTLAEKLLKHQQAQPTPVSQLRPEVPPKVSAIVDRLLAKRPLDRYQSPAELIRELQALPWGTQPVADSWDTFGCCSEPTPITGTDIPPGALAKRRKPMSRRFLIGVVAAGCGAVFLAGLMLYPPGQSSSSPHTLSRPASARATAIVATVPAVSSQLAVGPAFLADLPEVEAQVGFGQFGKKGALGFANKSITVKGAPSPNGLSMHPPRDGSARVVYALGKKYRSFTATAAINDDASSRSALTFRVLANSKEIWKSHPLKERGDSEACTAVIAGVDRLELEVLCPGKNDNAHAVWLEPQVRP